MAPHAHHNANFSLSHAHAAAPNQLLRLTELHHSVRDLSAPQGDQGLEQTAAAAAAHRKAHVSSCCVLRCTPVCCPTPPAAALRAPIACQYHCRVSVSSPQPLNRFACLPVCLATHVPTPSAWTSLGMPSDRPLANPGRVCTATCAAQHTQRQHGQATHDSQARRHGQCCSAPTPDSQQTYNNRAAVRGAPRCTGDAACMACAPATHSAALLSPP